MSFTKFFLIIIGISLGVGLAACGRIRQDQSAVDVGLNLDMTIEPAQAAVGPSRLIFSLTDAQGQLIDDAQLKVEGNMTHAGMVPVFAQAEPGQAGRYTVPFEWTMSGDWVVTVEVTLADGQQFSQQIPVTVQ